MKGNWGLQDIIGAMTWAQFYAPMIGGDTNDAALSGLSQNFKVELKNFVGCKCLIVTA